MFEATPHSFLCPILIGRDVQMAALMRMLDLARSGEGQIALISGEAGIGKTRLVAEVRKLALERGCTAVQGACFEPDRTLPYAPFLDLLRASRRTDRQAGELVALLSGQQPQSADDAEQAKRHVSRTLADFLLERAHLPFTNHQSQCIILEDLHWSDESSLEFLHVLARRLADQPQPEFATRIYELTEGNPFFVEETLKSLVAAGEIYVVDGRWTRKAIGHLHIPRTVQVAVAQRTAQLSEAARRVLVLAAVAGRRFDFALLQAITGHDEAHLIELIRELLRAQLVVEESAERFAFRHALTQQAIYRDLLRRERRPLHHAVAESIEQLYASARETHSGDLAAHFYEAEVWEKALPYARQAGERALALYAPQAAIEQFTRAIFAAQSLGRTSPALVPLSLLYRQRGQAYEWLGHFEDAHGDYRAALAAAHTEQNRQALWQAQIDLGFLWAQRDYTQAGDFFAQALAAARQMDDPSRLAHTLKRLGNWHMNVEHPDQSLSMLHEALQIFEALGDRRGIAETLDLQGIAHFAAANAIDGSRYYARAIEHFRQLDDPAGELNSLVVYAPRHAVYINNAAIWPADSGEDRRRDGDGALALARKLGAKPAEALALIWPANTLGVTGGYSAALQQVQAGLALAQQIDHLHFTTTGHMVLGGIYWEMLLLPEAQVHLEEALRGAQASRSLIWLGAIVGFLVSTYTQLGDWWRADALLNDHWRTDLPMRSHGQRQLWCARAELLLAQRQPDAALTTLDRLIAADPHTTALGQHAIPRLARLRGEALTHLERYTEAEETLLAARPFAQDAPPMLWRLHLALGNCYRRQNRRDEADRAYAAARTILAALATRIDEDDLRQRFVEQSHARFPAPTEKQAAKQSAAGLTAKEREVAALVAAGKSNKEIAAHLVVSHRTVETHVSNILSKLHLSSRAQIAVWAREAGAGTIQAARRF